METEEAPPLEDSAPLSPLPPAVEVVTSTEGLLPLPLKIKYYQSNNLLH